MTTLERALARLKAAAIDVDKVSDKDLLPRTVVSLFTAEIILAKEWPTLTEALAPQESAPAVGLREAIHTFHDECDVAETDAEVVEAAERFFQVASAPAREVPPVDDDTPLPLMPTGHYTVKATLARVDDAKEREIAKLRADYAWSKEAERIVVDQRDAREADGERYSRTAAEWGVELAAERKDAAAAERSRVGEALRERFSVTEFDQRIGNNTTTIQYVRETIAEICGAGEAKR